MTDYSTSAEQVFINNFLSTKDSLSLTALLWIKELVKESLLLQVISGRKKQWKPCDIWVFVFCLQIPCWSCTIPAAWARKIFCFLIWEWKMDAVTGTALPAALGPEQTPGSDPHECLLKISLSDSWHPAFFSCLKQVTYFWACWSMHSLLGQEAFLPFEMQQFKNQIQ